MHQGLDSTKLIEYGLNLVQHSSEMMIINPHVSTSIHMYWACQCCHLQQQSRTPARNARDILVTKVFELTTTLLQHHP